MPIDLRSDTLTKPDKAMRAAMSAAEVGDDGRRGFDGRGEDPTVRELEDQAAALTGKECALFVPSGTMGNILGVLAQTAPGDTVAVSAHTHIRANEGALFDESYFRRRPVAMSSESPTLVCLENTFAATGGRCLRQDELDWAGRLRKTSTRVHLDGARLFNAAVASDTTVATLSAVADTVTFCLSKGLGAPVGSVLCGDSSTIDCARSIRRYIGGAMRQAGVLAAAGLVAMRPDNIARIAEDHVRAKALAAALRDLDAVRIIGDVETNIVRVELPPQLAAQRVVARAAESGVVLRVVGDNAIRAVTYRDVGDADIATASKVWVHAIRAEEESVGPRESRNPRAIG
ncbi:beta-eliminating lyase-related protein [Mycolicibacterium mageritense]|uniref:beta-eliminating lyase-related protein n=1 Tax=Mycolicibacterium mageritense TaxID=53462 RepID=UPI001E4CC067|nr:beta-eliminating lyase-related protein [Mycolicibacterium mageritense]GJJ23874.1 threonine aldolase [Mycolicibacterium mageritense]